MGSGSHENGCPFKVVAMEKEVQTSIMHTLEYVLLSMKILVIYIE